MCTLSNDVKDYYYVAQVKLTIPNVDDGEECMLTDVRVVFTLKKVLKNSQLLLHIGFLGIHFVYTSPSPFITALNKALPHYFFELESRFKLAISALLIVFSLFAF